MGRSERSTQTRRHFLALAGGTAIAGLAGCSGNEDASAPAAGGAPAAEPAPEAAMEPSAEAAPQAEPAEAPASEPAAAPEGGDLPRLSEDDPTATSLGYVHDATTVDTSAYPRYAAGQQCANCALFQGGDAEWGPCSIFPGRAVKATGWCSVYAPRAG